MANYDIEVGENKSSSTCHCCGKKSCVGHGFVYKNDDAYAIYYVGWSNSHPDKKVSMALAIGDWGDSATNDDRTCFGIEASEGNEEVLFRVIDPNESPWPNTDLLGQMLTRDKGLSHSLLKEVFVIAESVLRGHVALREYLTLPEEQKPFGVKH